MNVPELNGGDDASDVYCRNNTIGHRDPGHHVSLSHAQSCQSLWVERNTYYKDGGYCFKTSRGINYFGNAGCRYDSENAVPLSRSARERIAAISRQEQRLGCN